VAEAQTLNVPTSKVHTKSKTKVDLLFSIFFCSGSTFQRTPPQPNVSYSEEYLQKLHFQQLPTIIHNSSLLFLIIRSI